MLCFLPRPAGSDGQAGATQCGICSSAVHRDQVGGACGMWQWDVVLWDIPRWIHTAAFRKGVLRNSPTLYKSSVGLIDPWLVLMLRQSTLCFSTPVKSSCLFIAIMFHFPLVVFTCLDTQLGLIWQPWCFQQIGQSLGLCQTSKVLVRQYQSHFSEFFHISLAWTNCSSLECQTKQPELCNWSGPS